MHIPLQLGDIAAATLKQLATVIEQHGERAVRATQSQNLVLRWVHEGELTALHARLAALGLAEAPLPVLRNLIACTGAATCKLGICLSRGLAQAVAGEITSAELDLAAAGDLRLHISGCPNACGRHPIADIGFHGVARRVNDRLVPHYVLQVGGYVAETGTKFAEGSQAVPAKSLPALVRELLTAFRRSEQFPNFRDFLDAGGRQLASVLTESHKQVPSFEDGRDYYSDWGTEALFSLAGRGPGECGAGVFDLIEVDLQSAREALGEQRLRDAVVLAARALLVTRGQQANDERQALDLFQKYFVEEQLVDAAAGALIDRTRQAVGAPLAASVLVAELPEVAEFVATIERLYASMDASLRFKPAEQEVKGADGTPPLPPPTATREADFRGVICPLNYVKTKLLLGQMRSGEILSVLLDEPGTRNVPDSVRQDGHEVLSVGPAAEHWKIVIRKA